MTSPRFARGTKSRMLAYLGALLLFIAVLFLYHNARVEVSAEKEALAKCQQTQESLSAQLQVIFEYKVRLERNLNEERHRHQETKDKLMTHMSEEQERNKENKETHTKYTALQQQFKLLQTRFEDYKAENEKARATVEGQLKFAEEKAAYLEKLKSQASLVREEADANKKKVQELRSEVGESNTAVERLKKENEGLKKDNEDLKAQLESLEKRRKGTNSSTDRGGVIGPDGGLGVAGAPAGALAAPNPGRPPSSSSSVATPDGRQGMNAVIADQLAASNSKALGKQSTTPQINPEALLSQEKAGHGVVGGGVIGGGVLAPPVAPPPPSDREPASQGPQHPALVDSKNHENQDVHQQQGAVLPMPLPFQQSQNQLQQPAVAAAAAVAPAVIPAQPPPQQHHQHLLRESPSNQGQPPPLYDGSNIFQAPIPLQRNFGVPKERADWDAPLQRSVDVQRREPVAAPVEGRGQEERLRADWARQQAPFQGMDYDREVHAGENEEDDDDDADQMDNGVNARTLDKRFGANKFLDRNVMVNPR